MESRDPSWSGALAELLLVTCVVVPFVFTRRLDAVFAAPKLVVLWAVLVLSLVLVAGGVLLSSQRPSGARAIASVDIAVAAFLVLNVAAWISSSDRDQSLYGERLEYQGLLTILLYIGLFYVARLASSTGHRLRQLFWAVAIGASFVSGYALVQKAGLDPVWDGYLPEGRVFSSIGQANALAAYLVLAIPVTVALLVHGRLPLRAVSSLAVVTMTAALVLTLSRGGYLGLIAASLVLVAGLRGRLRPHARRLAQIGAACLAAVIGVVVLIGATDAAFTQPVRRPFSIGDASVRFHVDAWHVAIRIAAEHPLLGTGQETFPDVFPRYSHDVLPTERAAALDAFRVESPHNVYLGIAAGAGIPALIAYVGLLAAFVLTVVRAARTADPHMYVALVAVLAATAGHLVTDAFMTADVTSTSLFWILMGATLGFVSARTSVSADKA